MTISIVQSKTEGFDGLATKAFAFAGNVAAGHLMVNIVWKRNVGTIDAPAASGWTKIGEESNNGSGDDGSTAMFWKATGAGGFSSIGTWVMNPGDPCRSTLFELAGVDTSAAFASGTTPNHAATNHPVLNAISGTAGGGILIAGICYASGFGETFTPDSGFTLPYQGQCGSGSPAAPTGCVLYEIANLTSYTPGATATLGGKRYCGVAAVFADSTPAALARVRAAMVA